MFKPAIHKPLCHSPSASVTFHKDLHIIHVYSVLNWE